MPLTPSWRAISPSSSALSFNSRTSGSSSAAAASKFGAIDRHGPHHGAHTSTSTAMSLDAMCRWKAAPSTLSGFAANSGALQEPQRAALAGLSSGRRLVAPQPGQTT